MWVLRRCINARPMTPTVKRKTHRDGQHKFGNQKLRLLDRHPIVSRDTQQRARQSKAPPGRADSIQDVFWPGPMRIGVGRTDARPRSNPQWATVHLGSSPPAIFQTNQEPWVLAD